MDVRTDLVPELEMTRITTRVVGEGRETVHDVAPDGDWFAGVRVARFDGLAANLERELEVAVEGPAGVVARRTAIFAHRGRFAITLTFTRDCRDVSCDDVAAETCLGGRCVPQGCLTGAEPECPPPECSSDAECPAGDACAVASCVDAVCVFRRDDGACEPGRVCVPDEGCRARGPVDPCAGGVCDCGGVRRIHAPGGSADVEASIAWAPGDGPGDGARYFVAWTAFDGQLLGQWLSASTAPLGPTLVIAEGEDAYRPRVATHGPLAATVAWTRADPAGSGGRQVWALTLDGEGQRVAEGEVSAPGNVFDPHVLSTDPPTVAWMQYDGRWRPRLLPFDGADGGLPEDIPFDTGTMGELEIASSGRGIGFATTGGGGAPRVAVRPEAAPIGRIESLVPAGDGIAIASDGAGWLVLVPSGAGLHATDLDPAGAVGTTTELVRAPVGTIDSPRLSAHAPGRYLVAWAESADGFCETIRWAITDGGSILEGPVTLDVPDAAGACPASIASGDSMHAALLVDPTLGDVYLARICPGSS